MANKYYFSFSVKIPVTKKWLADLFNAINEAYWSHDDTLGGGLTTLGSKYIELSDEDKNGSEDILKHLTIVQQLQIVHATFKTSDAFGEEELKGFVEMLVREYSPALSSEQVKRFYTALSVHKELIEKLHARMTNRLEKKTDEENRDDEEDMDARREQEAFKLLKSRGYTITHAARGLKKKDDKRKG